MSNTRGPYNALLLASISATRAAVAWWHSNALRDSSSLVGSTLLMGRGRLGTQKVDNVCDSLALQVMT